MLGWNCCRQIMMIAVEPRWAKNTENSTSRDLLDVSSRQSSYRQHYLPPSLSDDGFVLNDAVGDKTEDDAPLDSTADTAQGVPSHQNPIIVIQGTPDQPPVNYVETEDPSALDTASDIATSLRSLDFDAAIPTSPQRRRRYLQQREQQQQQPQPLQCKPTRRLDVFISRESSFSEDMANSESARYFGRIPALEEEIDELNLSQEQVWVRDSFHGSSSMHSLRTSTHSKKNDNNNNEHHRENHIVIQEPETEPRVSFGMILIREYPITVGDNPSTTKGVPVALAWRHHAEYQLPVEEFEQVRPEYRRSPLQLQMSSLDRLRRLKAEGWSGAELTRFYAVDHRSRIKVRPGWIYFLEERMERLWRGLLNATVRRRKKKREREWIQQCCRAAARRL